MDVVWVYSISFGLLIAASYLWFAKDHSENKKIASRIIFVEADLKAFREHLKKQVSEIDFRLSEIRKIMMDKKLDADQTQEHLAKVREQMRVISMRQKKLYSKMIPTKIELKVKEVRQ